MVVAVRPGVCRRWIVFGRTRFVWQEVEVTGGSILDTSIPVGTPELQPRTGGQVLTATSQGVWVDGQLGASGAGAPTSATVFLTPTSTSGSGAAARASAESTWCYPANALCGHTLAAPLPPTAYRSIAWPAPPGASANDFGTRIPTGLPGGALQELSQTGDFTYVVGSGGLATAAAAFTSPRKAGSPKPPTPKSP
jgi:hypothetical protein